MEQFDQGWGTILYRTTLPAVKEGTTLLIDEVHDWAQVFADGKLLGRLDRRRGENTVVLPALAAGTRLDILVEAMDVSTSMLPSTTVKGLRIRWN